MIRIADNGVVRLPKAKNVLGGKLETCCTSPMTGFFEMTAIAKGLVIPCLPK